MAPIAKKSKEPVDVLESAVKVASSGPLKGRWHIVGAFVVCVIVFVFFSIDRASRSESSQAGGGGGLGGKVVLKGHIVKRNDAADGVCYTVCDARRKIVDTRFGDLSNASHVQSLVDKAIDLKMKDLKEQYGEENLWAMYKRNDAGPGGKPQFKGFLPHGPSEEKLKRKFLIKILKAQIGLEESSKSIDGCDCSGGSYKAVGNVPDHAENATEYLNLDKTFSRFVWTTGGHSASAGHGNLFNETFTAFLERALSPVFQSVGVEFVGRNYAMGGTGSGAEIALCSRSIFGEETDTLSWDYGMTDGAASVRILFYGYRAGLLKSWPALFGIHLNGRTGPQRTAQFLALREMGMAVFPTNETEMDETYKAIPDTEGMTLDEIKAMPPMVRNFKCNGNVESGEPYCSIEKYNMAVCPTRKGRAGWHPGVKSHSMDGTRIALLFMQLLGEAVSSPQFLNAKDLKSLLTELEEEEKRDQEVFKKAPLPSNYKTLCKKLEENDTEAINIIYRQPNICHTARLPADIRYKGVLTNQLDKVGGPANVDEEEHVIGIPLNIAIVEAKKKYDAGAVTDDDKVNQMQLILDTDRPGGCPVIVHIDYKDAFFGSSYDGWSEVTVPNPAEIAEYGYDDPRGLVLACQVNCPWGKCPKGHVDVKGGLNATEISLRVNGVEVTDLIEMEGCVALAHKDGLYHKKNAEGLFDIGIKANLPDTYVRISSFIVY